VPEPFFLSRDFVDYPRLADTVARLDVEDALHRAAGVVAVTRVDEDFRFGDGTRLRELARALKTVCDGLSNTDVAAAGERVRAELRQVLEAAEVAPGVLVARVRHLNERLGIYGLHEMYDGPTWRRWSDALADLRAADGAHDFDDLRRALEALLTPTPSVFGHIAWLHRVRSLKGRPDYRLLAAAVELCAGVEARAKVHDREPPDGIIRLVLRRRDELLACLDAAGEPA
jgi:hypothetical protein